ncbi:MAG TPA: hypothetical protein VD908_15465 [Cytophagales bacterium]|nr:hypothetical protein [Cytophagales bacterium]
MRNFLIVFGLFLLMSQTEAFAQIDSQKLLYLKKVESYKRMKNTGFIMTGIGVVTTAVGVSIIAQEERNYNNNSSKFDEDRVVTGILCAVLGIPITAGGLVLGLIGTHKVNRYRDKLDNLSLNFRYAPSQKGIVLKYTF